MISKIKAFFTRRKKEVEPIKELPAPIQPEDYTLVVSLVEPSVAEEPKVELSAVVEEVTPDINILPKANKKNKSKKKKKG